MDAMSKATTRAYNFFMCFFSSLKIGNLFVDDFVEKEFVRAPPL
jgi:hypothetical protein